VEENHLSSLKNKVIVQMLMVKKMRIESILKKTFTI